jgi:hypothetical protein
MVNTGKSIKNCNFSTLIMQVIVGTPGFNYLEQILNLIKEKESLCYIAQTLVEGGRLPRLNIELFVFNLAQAFETLGIKFLVSLHPCSDIRLYSSLEGKATFS